MIDEGELLTWLEAEKNRATLKWENEGNTGALIEELTLGAVIARVRALADKPSHPIEATINVAVGAKD